jgi:hypothetical protein
VAGDLHELVPYDEIQKEQNDNVAGEEDRVLVVSLVEVVKDGQVELNQQLLVAVFKINVF